MCMCAFHSPCPVPYNIATEEVQLQYLLRHSKMDIAWYSSMQILLLLLVADFLQAVTITPLPFLGYGFNVRPGARAGKATFLGYDEANRVRRAGAGSSSHKNQIGTGYTTQKSQPGFYGKPSQYDYDSYKTWNNGGNAHREYYPKYSPEDPYWDDNGYRNRRGNNCEPGSHSSFAGHGYFDNNETPNLQGGAVEGWSQGTRDEDTFGTTEDSGYPSGGSWDSGKPGSYPSGNGGSWNGQGDGSNKGRGPGFGSWNRPRGRPGGGSWNKPGGGPGGGTWDRPRGGPGGSRWNTHRSRPGGGNWNRPGGGTGDGSWDRPGGGSNGGNWNRPGGGPGGGSWNRPGGGPSGGSWDQPGGNPGGGTWSRPGSGGGNWNGPSDGGWKRPWDGGSWNGPGGGSSSNWDRPGDGGSWNAGTNSGGNRGGSWDSPVWGGDSSATGGRKWNNSGSSGEYGGDSVSQGTVGFYGTVTRD